MAQQQQQQQVTDGYPHRHPHFYDSLCAVPPEQLEQGFTTRTLYDISERARKLYAEQPCLGTRQYLRDGTRGGYVWSTYTQVADRSDALRSGLANLGVKPGERVASYSINREEIIMGDIACYGLSCPTVSLYDTLGEDSIGYVLQHSEAVAVFCSRDKTANVLAVVNQCPSIRFVIQMEDWAAQAVDAKYREKEQGNAQLQRLKSQTNVKVVEFEDLVAEGQKHPRDPVPPKPEDLVSILYTSGTTGVPKGVMLSHANVVSAVAAFRYLVPTQPGDVHLSYLPLAHIYERAVFAGGMYNGTRAGFYQGDVKKLIDDIVELQPTVFCGVPRVFQKIYDRIMQTVNSSMWHRRELFHYAYASKVAAMKAGETTPWLDKLVFSKIAARLGGRIRLIITGSAPLSPQLHEFLTVCLCCPVVQGYGLSETTAAATLSLPDSPTSGHCGGPVGCTEVKLVSIPEMNYLVTDKPCARGEVCLRGPNIFSGYYKMDEQTKEVFTPDGWFMTGDVGRWNPDGTLSIIDRKKNIFKLSQGEYVAAEKLETLFQRSKYIQQIFVYGDSFEDHLVAIIVPEPEFLRSWAEANLSKKEADAGTAALCQHPKVRKLFAEELDAQAKEEKLKGFECINSFHLEPVEWTPDNGLVTPTFKLKRPSLKQHYAAVIRQLYNHPTNNETAHQPPAAAAAAGPHKEKARL
eukprot:TRINITY_DN53_c0_g2_i1.p1 TRINITY_DN53_c0_g2~~TRINITY_DN53_c0_g2_i1.p1  ORF type:complete len:690 (+),score=128.49 TRINITY_DN53_c0_g2_i1:158-2227(+)